MTWVKVLTLLLTVAQRLTDYMSRKQIMDAGAAKSASRNMQEAIHAIRRAESARRAAHYVPDQLRDDVYNRDK